jgi:replicative DNA helicase
MADEVTAVHTAKEVNNNPWANGVQRLMEKVQGDTYKPIPTGIESLDKKVLGGGFISQQLVGLSGRPGAGKTAFGQWLTESMALNREDFSAVYFCFEMSQEQLQARSISRLLHGVGKDLTPLEVLQGKDGWAQGAKMYSKLYADKVLYLGMGSGLDTSKGTSLEAIEAKFAECVRYNHSIGRPAPFFVVDYLQIVKIKGMAEIEAIGEIMAHLKGLAVKYNTVGLVIIANNRESNKGNENNMFSGRGSSSIEYGLDCMLALSPNEDDMKSKLKNRRITLAVTKGRWIENAEASFIFNGASMSYVEVDKMGRVLNNKEQRIANDLWRMDEG